VGRIALSGQTSRQRPQELHGGNAILTFITDGPPAHRRQAFGRTARKLSFDAADLM
jgi:hypothetical protein